ncbi:MAG TPA: hypothetical protein VG435_05000 [Acidimicrobiales bacterium]|nr:hypothetical protein [Acidimicrobiales bacterium]
MSPDQGESPDEASEGPDLVTANDVLAALVPSAEALGAAKAELEALLAAADISLIVFVDNEFDVSVEAVISAIREMPPEYRSLVSELGGNINFDLPEGDEQVWVDQVIERFESMSPWQRSVAGADALARSGRSNLREQPNAGFIGPLIPQDLTELLSPADWEARKAEILREAPTRGTLILFDRDFEDGDNAGLHLLREVFDSENGAFVRAGLITNTVTRETEAERTRDFVEEFGLPSDRTVVISKQNLAGGSLSLPQSLKVALLTPQFDALLTRVAQALIDAHDESIDHLRNLSPYTFERIVFAFSNNEGVWEPETLLRLASITNRKSALRSLRGDVLVHAEVGTARRVAGVLTSVPSESTFQAEAVANQLQHLEIFENGEYVNGVHLPLELGDVFMKRGGKASYVLVAQPCDLMVRKGGRRSPEPEFLTLVRIYDSPPDGERQHWHEIPFFKENGETGFAALNRSFLVPPESLDLCVYNGDGSSEISIDAPTPERVTPHWDSRYEIHQTWAKSCIERVLAVQDEGTRVLVGRALFKCMGGGLASSIITGNNKILRFNFIRIGRLRQPVSLEVLGSFLAYQGRYAFEGRLVRHPIEG